MKNLGHFLLNVFIILSVIMLTSCESDEDEGKTTLTTVVKGVVKDFDQNIPYPDVLISVTKKERSNGGFDNFWTGGFVYREIATALSDRNGNYMIEFEHERNGQYAFDSELNLPYTKQYEVLNYTPLVGGGITVRDYGVWESNVIELRTNVINNPHGLNIQTKFPNGDRIPYPSSINISQNQIRDTSFFRVRRNATINLVHRTSDNGNVRFLTIPISTTTQDTLIIENDIDTNTF